MFTFDEPDGVQGWESDEKVFLDKACGLSPKVWKMGLFSKARVRVSFLRCDNFHFNFDGANVVQSWERDKNIVLGKKWTLQKLGLALG